MKKSVFDRLVGVLWLSLPKGLWLQVRDKHKSNKLLNPFYNYLGLIFFGVFVHDRGPAHSLSQASDLLKNYLIPTLNTTKMHLCTAVLFSDSIRCISGYFILFVRKVKTRIFLFCCQRRKNTTFLPMKWK